MTRRLILALGLGAAALSVVGAFEPILAAVGGGLTAVALIAQYRAAGAVRLPFSAEDRHADGDELAIRFPSWRHGRRNPVASVWIHTDHGWAEPWAGAQIEEDGTIHVRVSSEEERFPGEVRVR